MKANTTQMPSGKAAFTLVELLVVVGLMALLGTVSVTGYFAAARGMSDRAALQDSISIVRLAMQTCLIDQTPTAVLFYNRQMNVGDKVTSDEARASGAGAAIAIKMVGRISYVEGNNVLVDEFADWNQDCDMSLFGRADELRQSPKDIVVLKEGVISRHHFENKLGISFGVKQITKDEKQQINQAYKKWKEQ
jgi:type II secretory pathway pseudopilin PulG